MKSIATKLYAGIFGIPVGIVTGGLAGAAFGLLVFICIMLTMIPISLLASSLGIPCAVPNELLLAKFMAGGFGTFGSLIGAYILTRLYYRGFIK